jgi:CheY-like chemotaxis protein
MKIEDLTILVVEDNPTDVILIRRAFEQAKLANPVQFVAHGDADRSKFPLPILMLLDLKLPRRSGLEVLKWLRSQENLKRLPVVVLTSSKEDRDINAAYDIGVNSYLVKPVEFPGLLEMLKAINLYWLMLNERPKLGDDLG